MVENLGIRLRETIIIIIIIIITLVYNWNVLEECRILLRLDFIIHKVKFLKSLTMVPVP